MRRIIFRHFHSHEVTDSKNFVDSMVGLLSVVSIYIPSMTCATLGNLELEGSSPTSLVGLERIQTHILMTITSLSVEDHQGDNRIHTSWL